MRLLIANHHRTLVGGVETYLAALMPALESAGHQLLFVHEAPPPTGAPLISLPQKTESLQKDMGAAIWKDWKPDLVYMHAMHDLDFQERLMTLAPSVAFAHGYYGLCISGTKTWKRTGHACSKQFDWKCLLHFHAKRCGGVNPIRMFQDFRDQSRQLQLLKKCDALLTHGGRMRDEYIAQGVAADRVFAIPHFVAMASKRDNNIWRASSEIRLIFVGRFDELKGGHFLLRALPLLDRPVVLNLVGSGPAEAVWKKIADQVSNESIRIKFHGWIEGARKDALLAESDLLVVPSIWPEPFGQVGLEAAAFGVPAVAFDVGGIPNWLRDGINGIHAPANPPTAQALAEAILKALGNPEQYANMRVGAQRVAGEFSIDRHLRALGEVFELVLRKRK